MSDSGEKDQETYSGHVTKKEQWAHIKIKRIRGGIISIIITLNLCEAYSHDTVNRS